MSWAPLRAVALDVAFTTFGVPATVTRPWPDDTAIATIGIWDSAENLDAGGFDLARREQRRVLALRRSVVPTVRRGSVIEAPLVPDGVALRWLVDGTDRVSDDLTYVRLVADPEGA